MVNPQRKRRALRPGRKRGLEASNFQAEEAPRRARMCIVCKETRHEPRCVITDAFRCEECDRKKAYRALAKGRGKGGTKYNSKGSRAKPEGLAKD